IAWPSFRGASETSEPGNSRFRVWSFEPSLNDCGEPIPRRLRLYPFEFPQLVPEPGELSLGVMAGVGAAGRRRRPASRRASIRASSSSRLARSALAPMYPLPNYVGIGEERAMMSDERQRSVIWHGMLLFLLGL